jgi:uncharacterized membrane protein (UPF0136 family)
MYKLAILVTAAYAALGLLGGILGYVNKGSTASLLAGGCAALLLAFGAWVAWQGRSWGMILALVVCLALIGRFLPTYLKDTQNVWPALVMVAGGVLTAVLLAVGLATVRKP